MNNYTLHIIGFIIALSGWAKVIYDYVTSRPRIRGQVLQVMRGQMTDPRDGEKRLSAVIAYLHLVNKRRNTIHVLDYELEIKVGGAWVKLSRVYGIHNVKNFFGALGGGNIEIQNFEGNLIYRQGKPVEYGQPLHGWIVFVGSENLHSADIAAFRLTCVDAFRKKHRFVTKKGKLVPCNT
jgi:hypothetical protein